MDSTFYKSKKQVEQINNKDLIEVIVSVQCFQLGHGDQIYEVSIIELNKDVNFLQESRKFFLGYNNVVYDSVNNSDKDDEKGEVTDNFANIKD